MISAEKIGVKTHLALWVLLAGALIPWFFIRIQQAMNPDILWLCEALQRYFNGCRLSECGYETNPPLSLLIYTLPVLAQDWLGLPLYYTVFVQTCLIVLAGAWATYKILHKWGTLRAADIYIITAAYVLANTIGASLYFGERDHLIGIALVPFVLMQLTLTFGLNRDDRLKWLVFISGALMILIKPHHGLIPTLTLLHRVFYRRNLSVLRDADFLSLAILTPLYMAFVALVFPDYVRIILPDVFLLYRPDPEWDNLTGFIITALSASALVAAAIRFMPVEETAKKLTLFLSGAAVLSIIPYAVQGLGFYYHVLPVYAFLWPAAAMAVLYWLRTQSAHNIPVFFTAIFVIVFAYAYAPLNLAYPRHGEYASLPLTKLLNETCPKSKPCSFFMFNRDMGIMNETAYYTGIHHASRFPSFWFLPQIINSAKSLKKGEPARLDQSELAYYTRKYSTFVAEDFARDKPDVLIIWKPDKQTVNIDFVKFFTANPEFAKEWKHYRKDKPIRLSYREYFRGTATEKNALDYDVYRRISP